MLVFFVSWSSSVVIYIIVMYIHRWRIWTHKSPEYLTANNSRNHWFWLRRHAAISFVYVCHLILFVRRERSPWKTWNLSNKYIPLLNCEYGNKRMLFWWWCILFTCLHSYRVLYLYATYFVTYLHYFLFLMCFCEWFNKKCVCH